MSMLERFEKKEGSGSWKSPQLSKGKSVNNTKLGNWEIAL